MSFSNEVAFFAQSFKKDWAKLLDKKHAPKRFMAHWNAAKKVFLNSSNMHFDAWVFKTQKYKAILLNL